MTGVGRCMCFMFQVRDLNLTYSAAGSCRQNEERRIGRILNDKRKGSSRIQP